MTVQPLHSTMKIRSLLTPALLLASFLLVAPFGFAAPCCRPSEMSKTAAAGKLIPLTEKDAAWAAKARETYPLDVCVTSDEKLDSMGKSPAYAYRVDGQPDRLVLLCCDGCEEDFIKEPAKYLSKIDAAAAKAKK